jgi:heme/copper-type cytochrome/quinol oxidase subunit 2
MITQSDIQGRLRLLRYGLIVVTVLAFFISLLGPYAIAAPWANEFNQLAAAQGIEPKVVNITDWLGFAIGITIGVAVVSVIIYFGYRAFLTRSNSGTPKAA